MIGKRRKKSANASEQNDDLATLPADELGKELPRDRNVSNLADEIAEGEKQRRGQQKWLFRLVSCLVCISFVATGVLIWKLGKGELELAPTGQVAAIAAFGVQPFLLIRGLTTSVYRGNAFSLGDRPSKSE